MQLLVEAMDLLCQRKGRGARFYRNPERVELKLLKFRSTKAPTLMLEADSMAAFCRLLALAARIRHENRRTGHNGLIVQWSVVWRLWLVAGQEYDPSVYRIDKQCTRYRL